MSGPSIANEDGEDNPTSSLLPSVVLESSFQSMPNDFRSALDEFRDNWKRELKGQTSESSHIDDQETQLQQQNILLDKIDDTLPITSHTTDNEQQLQAEKLFRKAVELEQRGKVYDALPLYRKAVQMVPDIEFKFYEHHIQKIPMNVEIPTIKSLDENSFPRDQKEEMNINLYEKFQLDLANDYPGKLLVSNYEQGILNTELHISDMPPEILLYILRWVVTSQLDMRSLEQCAAVCKGFYLCARDEELWRLACVKVWGASTGILNKSGVSVPEIITPEHAGYNSWRQMYIERERVLFSGCYISKTTYLRMGENSFQDQYYRPLQLVEYYRYVRFLPDGTVLFMTNADEPSQGVTKLKNLQLLRSDVLIGHYRLQGNAVTIYLKKYQQQQLQRYNANNTHGRQRKGSSAFTEDLNCIKFQIDFRIVSTTKRKFTQLVWQRYSIIQMRNKLETASEFELSPSKYPPLWFSPVRSYHLDADAPLV